MWSGSRRDASGEGADDHDAADGGEDSANHDEGGLLPDDGLGLELEDHGADASHHQNGAEDGKQYVPNTSLLAIVPQSMMVNRQPAIITVR